ncbi:DegV family protein [Thermus thermophilus SG0.5JP17-16]|uniref:DegV family protein n=1 Tax=Thermus thermophilus (strain SG0.5JP17-16) TaxID=762633 RepID=F6DG19_THETG|nr:hypothetical protein [Thermus thermophilus]AEG33183.1 DegV family protein [Thermus thermophilus SG0.5JP17-16]
MELGLLSERGGLSRENDPFIWDPIKESLEGACKRLLALYDRVLLLMTRPPFGAHLALAEALRERYPGRLLLHATPLFGPGLQALHERAEELLGKAEPEDVLAELRRMEREGRLYLASADPEALRRQGWLPPGGGLALRLGLYALFALEEDRLRLPPLPVPEGQVPAAFAEFWGRAFAGRPVRAYLNLGKAAPPSWRRALEEGLKAHLALQKARLSPMPRDLQERIGAKSLLGFAYPL